MSLFLSYTLVFCSFFDDTLTTYLCEMCSMKQKNKIANESWKQLDVEIYCCTNEFAVFSNVN